MRIWNFYFVDLFFVACSYNVLLGMVTYIGLYVKKGPQIWSKIDVWTTLADNVK